MELKFENIIHGEENLIDFLDKATPWEVEELKGFIRGYYKNDVLARRVILSQIKNYYY